MSNKKNYTQDIDELILEKLKKFSPEICEIGIEAIKLSKSGKTESEVGEILEILIKKKTVQEKISYDS